MRLLMWVSNYGETIGGGPVLAPLLAESFVQRGHQVIVLSDRRPEALPATEFRKGVHIERPEFRRALAGDTALFTTIRKQVIDVKTSFQPDVSLIFSSRYGDYFHQITRRPSSPLVVSLHDCFPPARYGPESLLGRHLRTAAHVIGCSKAVLTTACSHVSSLSAIASVIRNALPVPPPPVSRSALLSSGPRLAFLGRLIPQKGADILIAAMAVLAKAHPDLRLAIAGFGSEQPALEQQVAEHRLTHAVEFKGELSRDQVPSFLSQAEIVVMPSRAEPFGLVALEAAQMGRPVVASAVDGLPEIVVHGETGLLVPPEDPASLAAAIDALLSNPEYARALGRSANERANTLFRWEDYVARYERILEAARC